MHMFLVQSSTSLDIRCPLHFTFTTSLIRLQTTQSLLGGFIVKSTSSRSLHSRIVRDLGICFDNVAKEIFSHIETNTITTTKKTISNIILVYIINHLLHLANITLFKSITLFSRTNNIVWNIPHVQYEWWNIPHNIVSPREQC